MQVGAHEAVGRAVNRLGRGRLWVAWLASSSRGSKTETIEYPASGRPAGELQHIARWSRVCSRTVCCSPWTVVSHATDGGICLGWRGMGGDEGELEGSPVGEPGGFDGRYTEQSSAWFLFSSSCPWVGSVFFFSWPRPALAFLLHLHLSASAFALASSGHPPPDRIPVPVKQLQSLHS